MPSVHYYASFTCALHTLSTCITSAWGEACSLKQNCDECKHNLACYWCVEEHRCHGIFDDTDKCTWSDSYWLVCSVNAIVSLAITIVLLLMLTTCCSSICCWTCKRVNKYREQRQEREYEQMQSTFAARRQAAQQEEEQRRHRREQMREKYGVPRSPSMSPDQPSETDTQRTTT